MQRALRFAGVKLKGARALLRMRHAPRNPSGTAQSQSEIAASMLEHFASLEAGRVIEHAALTRQHLSRPPLQYDPHIGNVPTLLQTTRFAAKTSPHKAIGPDGVHPALESMAPHATARHIHPLAVKIALLAREPLIAKGGEYVPLHKGGPDDVQVASYRAILLNSRIAKHHHAFLRSRLVTLLAASHTVSQCCGLPGRGTDIAAFTVRTFWDYIRFRNAYGALLHLDIKSAFYSVLRELLVDLPTDTQDFLEVVDSTPIPDLLKPAVFAMVAAPSLLHSHVGDSHLTALITDAMQNTWFSMVGVDRVVQTRKGTRPGDNLGDILFNLTMIPVLIDIGAYAHRMGYSRHPVPPAPGRPVPPAIVDVTYYDDITIMRHSSRHPRTLC